MATRNPQAPGRKPGEVCTEFHLHASQLPGADRHNIADYSEFRLKRYIAQVTDEQQLVTLNNVLVQYKRGQIAVAWKGGKPVWISVTKG